MHFSQTGFGIETVQLRQTDQAVDRRSALPACICKRIAVGFRIALSGNDRDFGNVNPLARTITAQQLEQNQHAQ
jgi:hypothetical protein